MTTQETAARSDAKGRGNWMPAVAAVVTGVAGGATLVVIKSHLGLEAMAPFVQLWTIWAVMAAGLTFSFQQWAAIHPVNLGVLRDPENRRIGLALGVLGAGVWVVGTVWRSRLFYSELWVWPTVAATLPFATALGGICRGILARAESQYRLAAAIAGENLIRLAAAVVLVVLGLSAPWFSLVVIVGFAVVVIAIGVKPSETAPSSLKNRSGQNGTLSASAGAGFVAYAIMFGSPILLSLTGGEPEDIAVLFLVLAGVRVPFVLLQAIVPQLAVWLSAAADAKTSLHRERRLIAVVAVVGTAVAGLGSWLLGDVVIGTVFGIRGELGRTSYGALSAASLLAICALVATVLLVVEGRSGRIVTAWCAAMLSGLVAFVFGLLDEIETLSLWLVAAYTTVVVIALIPAFSSGEASKVEGASSE